MENNILLNSDNKFLRIELLHSDAYFTFYITIKSEKFSGGADFSVFESDISCFIKALSTMHNKLVGSCTLKDINSDSYIKLEMIKLGKMLVYGKIEDSFERFIMKFEIESDQSVLPNLINIFERALLTK
ncbi:MAG: hypothetical protein WC436_05095 [Candidatus Babeliales bacterium]